MGVDRVIEVPVGSKGKWDPAINTGKTGSLSPRTAYILDNGHAYVTDVSDRVAHVEVKLADLHMARNKYQKKCTGKSGCVGDDGGHLIASNRGGAGDCVNSIPQASTLNRRDWKAMENLFRSELKSGKTVAVTIKVNYPSSGGVRSSGFLVEAKIDGELHKMEYFQ